MNVNSLSDRFEDDRFRWSFSLALSAFFHFVAFGLGALIGQLVAGQPSNGGCVALLMMLFAGPFVALYATRM